MDTRDHIRGEVAAIRPFDDQETSDQRWTLEWIDSGAELFRTKKPDVPKVHLVAYFVVVDPATNSILLQHHLLAKKWLPSGGHVDPGELLTTTVARECEEELGAAATFLGEPAARFVTVTEVADTIGGVHSSHTDVSLWYLLQASRLAALRIEPDKFAEVRWWPIDDVLALPPEQINSDISRFITKWRQNG